MPTADDIQKGRLPGFGATVNVINGGVECGTGADSSKTKYRYQYYQYFATTSMFRQVTISVVPLKSRLDSKDMFVSIAGLSVCS